MKSKELRGGEGGRPVKLLWLSALGCNGSAHSLLNHPYLENFHQRFEWLYHSLLPSTYTLAEIARCPENIRCDVLLIEGTLEEGLQKGGASFADMVEHYGARAEVIVTVGTCSTFGGIFMQGAPGRHGLHYAGRIRHERFGTLEEKTLSLPGCPVQPEVLAGTLEMIAEGMEISRDCFRRPKAYYAYTVHNGCTRNEYFEYKIDDHHYGELEGCMFYDHGCQATYAHGSCNKILWNGVNSKTRVGQPCMGCTEPDFPIRDLWHTRKHMGIPARLPVGIPKRVYLSLAGVAKAFRIERFSKRLMDDE